MSPAKFRAALLVFLVGFLLGLSVFAASRLFVRSVLGADAAAAAQELASRLAENQPIDGNGALTSVVRYAYFGAQGELIRTASLGAAAERRPEMSATEIRHAAELVVTPAIVQPPLIPTLLGLAAPGVNAVAVPVISAGDPIGRVYVEFDQAAALASLTQAFSVVGMVTIGLAALAVITVAFAVARGGERRRFNPNALPRDALTGLTTRDGFVRALAHSVQQATRKDGQIGLMVIDLNAFRAVNDIWGHATGDRVLQTAAERLGAFASGPATLARISGDVFGLIVDRDANSHSLRQLADKIRASIGTPYKLGETTIFLEASIGAAIFPVNAEDAEALFRAADSALAKAKAEGRNTLGFFDAEMARRMQRRTELERDLRRALERDEFVLFYQPQLELASGKLRGYEALVRWERPVEGILSPREFLSVAEETGLIRPLGEWVLRKACRDAATWLDSGTVAVNISAAQFHFQNLDETIATILKETGLPAERLEIEVPERLFFEHSTDVMATLNRIKALGVRVAMDDFGAGYSGLSSLAHFPFDKVKIDRSFVSQLTEDADVAAIVSSIVGLGRSISVDITAEGVETDDQVTLLKAAGCSIVQGFLFGVPQRTPTHADPSPAAAAV